MFSIEEIYDAIKDGMSKDKLYKKYGGFSIYIPQKDRNFREKVLAEFNGYNHHALATKFNLSLNTIRKIIRESKASFIQGSLFDEDKV